MKLRLSVVGSQWSVAGRARGLELQASRETPGSKHRSRRRFQIAPNLRIGSSTKFDQIGPNSTKINILFIFYEREGKSKAGAENPAARAVFEPCRVRRPALLPGI